MLYTRQTLEDKRFLIFCRRFIKIENFILRLKFKKVHKVEVLKTFE